MSARRYSSPDRALQARMIAVSVLTPVLGLAGIFAMFALLPGKIELYLAIALVMGCFGMLWEWHKATEVEVLDCDKAPELHAMVERLCLAANVPKPRLVLEREPQPNSWVVAIPGEHPQLHVTQELLDLLEPEELQAVIAHELAHIANRDAAVMTVVGGPGRILLEGGSRGGNLAMPFMLLLGTLSTIATRVLSRYRELAADASACALTGRPSALASALLKVSGGLERVPQADLRTLAARNAFQLLPVKNAGSGVGAWVSRRRFLATHPALERRLAALEELERRAQRAGQALAD